MAFDYRSYMRQFNSGGGGGPSYKGPAGAFAQPAAPGLTPVHPAATPSQAGPGAFRGAGESASYYNTNTLKPEQYAAEGRAGALAGRYDAALANPTGSADQFSKYFLDAANANSAQANRDFQQTVSGVSGNIASRFGGNASTEEQRGVYNASDTFSRNLTENLAKLGPEAAQMGQNYTHELGSAQGQAAGQQDQLSQLIMQGIGMYPQKQKKSPVGGLIGAGLGALLAIPTGGLSIPAGAALGGSIGGATGV